MTTTKRRINISLGKETEKALVRIAKRDHVPLATKAEELVRVALETEEDVALGNLAEIRDTKNARYLPSDSVWG